MRWPGGASTTAACIASYNVGSAAVFPADRSNQLTDRDDDPLPQLGRREGRALGQPEPVVGTRELDDDHPGVARRHARPDLVRRCRRCPWSPAGPVAAPSASAVPEPGTCPADPAGAAGRRGRRCRRRRTHRRSGRRPGRRRSGRRRAAVPLDAGRATASTAARQPDVEPRRRHRDPATGRPPGLLEADHGGPGARAADEPAAPGPMPSLPRPRRDRAAGSPSAPPPRRRRAGRGPPAC